MGMMKAGLLLLLLTIFIAKARAFEACYSTSLIDKDFLAMPLTIFPEYTTNRMHFINKGYRYNDSRCKANQVWVQGPTYAEDGVNSEGEVVDDDFSHLKYGISYCMSAKVFSNERKLGQSIFETRVASGSKNEGTSFLVGDNIILTNHHIAGGGTPATNCRNTEITLNDNSDKWMKCKKILFCEKETDFCFVEITPPAGKTKVSELVPKVKLNCKSIGDQLGKLIGNSNLEGLQAGDGPVYAELSTGKFRHHVPMVGGSSGSPIFNSSDEVIGLNTSHDHGKDYVSTVEGKSNYGTSMSSILKKLKLEKSKPSSPFPKADLEQVAAALAKNPSCK